MESLYLGSMIKEIEFFQPEKLKYENITYN